jgi:hypothetical protein
MTPMIDAQGLQSLFQQPNMFLAQMGENAWNTQQDQQKADLAALLQKTQQDADMHPIKMMTEQNLGNQYGAQARSLNASADKSQDELKVLQSLPMDARRQNILSDYLKNKSEAEVAQTKAQMSQAAQWAAKAAQRPLTLQELGVLQQTNPSLATTLSRPGGAQEVMGWVNAHNKLDATRQREESVAGIQGANQLAVTRAQGENQLNLEDQQYKHGKYFKLANADLKIKIANAKNPENAWSIIQSAKAEAMAMPDGPQKEDLLNAINIHEHYAREPYMNYMAMKNTQAGKVDASGVSGLPSVPQPVAPPAGAGPRASAPLNANGVPDRNRRPPLDAFNK